MFRVIVESIECASAFVAKQSNSSVAALVFERDHPEKAK